MGRADTLSAFVKIPEENGYVEIEMKNHPGKQNLVFRREFKKSNNSSIWHMNGKKVTHKEVEAKVASMDIQVDNFWYGPWSKHTVSRPD